MDADQQILEEFIKSHSPEAARLIEQLSTEHSLALIDKIPIELAVLLFEQMEQYSVIKCIESMEVDRAVKIIEKLPVQLSATLFRRMNTDSRGTILAKVTPQLSLSLNQILKYSENSVGALMNPLVPTLPNDISVKDARERIKKHKRQLFHYVFITQRDNTFAGIVKLEDLFIAGSKEPLESIMKSDVPHLLVDTDVHKIVNHPGWVEYTALPVLERLGNFLGAFNQGEVRKIENDKKIKVPSKTTKTGNALGQLYRIGLEGLIHSAGERLDKEN